MKIIHLSTAISWRGGEQQLVNLYSELAKTPEVSQLIVCARGSKLAQYCQQHDYHFHTLRKVFSFNPIFAYQLRRLCHSFKADLLHIHDAHGHTLAVLSADIFGNTAPFVLARKVDFPINERRFSKYKYNHPQIQKIICVSHKIKEIISPAIQEEHKIEVVHDGVDIDRFQGKVSTGILGREYNIADDELLIGNVAALADHKDWYTFIDTAELLTQEGIRAKFLIIGEGSERQAIEAHIAQKQLSQQVILTGFRTNIPDILPELDVYLMTSKEEGLGSSLLDAMICKVPIVATKAGGIPEIVRDGETGLLAPAQKPAILAEQVTKLIQDSDLREQFIQSAATWVQGFSKAENAKKTLSIYQSC